MQRFVPVTALIVLSAGCAGVPVAPTPPHPAPAEVPAAWPASAPAAVDGLAGEAWHGFDDPLLPRLVDEALAANLELQSAAAGLARAHALRDGAVAALGPSAGAGASASRARSGGRGVDTLRAGLDARWPLDLSGARAAGVAAAGADADAAAAMLQATRLSVAAETALNYVQWQGVRRQIELADAGLASQVEARALVRARVDAGLAAAVALEQSTALLEQTRARGAQLRQALQQLEHALAVLLARAPSALSARLADAPRALPSAPVLPALAVPADVLRRRPDVRAAELKAGVALAALAQSRAERRPSFTISGSLALQAASLSGLGSAAALAAGLAAGVDWALYDNGAGAAQVAAQQAALDAARIGYRAAVLAALRDVEDGLAALAAARARVASLQRAAHAADAALALARHRWQAGVADFAGLLDSQRDALAAADALASARTELAAGHIRLLKSLGGGIGIDADRPAAAAAARARS